MGGPLRESRRRFGRELRLDPIGQMHMRAEEFGQQVEQFIPTQSRQQFSHRAIFGHTLRLADVSEQNSDDVLAIASQIIGTSTGGIDNTAGIQLNAHLVGFIPAAFDLRSQTVNSAR